MSKNKKLPEGQALRDFLNPEVFEAESKPTVDHERRFKLWVTLDELRPYDHNPRKSENPLYEEIKESIRNKGLEYPPHITKRNPDDKHYMIRDGGNTRLQILNELVDDIDREISKLEDSGEITDEKRLELMKERDRFFRVECEFIPWKSEIDALAGHMIENELRGGMLFIERAEAVARFRTLFEAELDKSLSMRELTELIRKQGWSVNAGDLTVYEYASRELLDFIPETLWAGAGRPYVKQLRQLQTGIERLWQGSPQGEGRPEGWKPIWQQALRETDAPDYSIEPVRELLTIQVAKQLDVKHMTIEATLAMILQNRTIGLDEIADYLSEKPRQPAQPAKAATTGSDGSPRQSLPNKEVSGETDDEFIDFSQAPDAQMATVTTLPSRDQNSGEIAANSQQEADNGAGSTGPDMSDHDTNHQEVLELARLARSGATSTPQSGQHVIARSSDDIRQVISTKVQELLDRSFFREFLQPEDTLDWNYEGYFKFFGTDEYAELGDRYGVGFVTDQLFDAPGLPDYHKCPQTFFVTPEMSKGITPRTTDEDVVLIQNVFQNVKIWCWWINTHYLVDMHGFDKRYNYWESFETISESQADFFKIMFVTRYEMMKQPQCWPIINLMREIEDLVMELRQKVIEERLQEGRS